MAETAYLELDDVLAIASEVLKLEVNALLHVTDVGLADSVAARPHAGFAGQEFIQRWKPKRLPCCWGWYAITPSFVRTP